jgi:hypothetical protein
MNNLELLVKLSSLGAAGISVLAVFITGNKIFNLPNDVSKTKVLVLKWYMTMCITMTIICGVSGVANAYFNQKKIAQATEDFNNLSSEYKNQIQKIESEKVRINSNIESLRMSLNQSNNLNQDVVNSLNITQRSVKEMNLLPYDEVLKMTEHKKPLRKER